MAMRRETFKNYIENLKMQPIYILCLYIYIYINFKMSTNIYIYMFHFKIFYIIFKGCPSHRHWTCRLFSEGRRRLLFCFVWSYREKGKFGIFYFCCRGWMDFSYRAVRSFRLGTSWENFSSQLAIDCKFNEPVFWDISYLQHIFGA